MSKKQMSNGQILGIMTSLTDESGKEMLKKKLPIKIVYALHRSTPEIEKAYKAYSDSLNSLCEQYGVKLSDSNGGTPKTKDEDKQKELDIAILELLNTKVDVDIYLIPNSVLEDYDDYHYDPLSFSDIDRLWWMIDKSESSESKEEKDG